MKIELKNIKYAAFASQETACFAATIWIDGVKRGTVENDGHGGSDNIHPHTLRQELDAHGLTLPMWSLDDSGITYPHNAETILGALLDAYLTERAVLRLMKKNIVYTKADKKGLWRVRKPEGNIVWSQAKDKLHADVILNVLPLADAVATYRANG